MDPELWRLEFVSIIRGVAALESIELAKGLSGHDAIDRILQVFGSVADIVKKDHGYMRPAEVRLALQRGIMQQYNESTELYGAIKASWIGKCLELYAASRSDAFVAVSKFLPPPTEQELDAEALNEAISIQFWNEIVLPAFAYFKTYGSIEHPERASQIYEALKAEGYDLIPKAKKLKMLEDETIRLRTELALKRAAEEAYRNLVKSIDFTAKSRAKSRCAALTFAMLIDNGTQLIIKQ